MAIYHKVDSIKEANEREQAAAQLPEDVALALEANAELGDQVSTILDALAELGDLIAGEV